MSNLLLHKSSVIHIPKCAGTILQALLFRLQLVKYRYPSPQDGHLFLHQMVDSKDTYNFCFVRHPYTWWPSFYNWSINTRFSDMEKLSPDFDTWIQEYGPFWLGLYTRLVMRYTGEDPVYAGDIKMHFIGKTENLFCDVYTAIKNAGESFNESEFLKITKDPATYLEKWSNKQEYVRTISDSSKELIYKTERWVFDRFGYSPDTEA